MSDEARHPVFFKQARVVLCLRVQIALLALAMLCLAGGAVWWALGGPGWALMLACPVLLAAMYAFSIAWRRRHEAQWWGGHRGRPPYLEGED